MKSNNIKFYCYSNFPKKETLRHFYLDYPLSKFFHILDPQKILLAFLFVIDFDTPLFTLHSNLFLCFYNLHVQLEIKFSREEISALIISVNYLENKFGIFFIFSFESLSTDYVTIFLQFFSMVQHIDYRQSQHVKFHKSFFVLFGK